MGTQNGHRVMPKTSVRPRILVIDDEPLLGQTIRLGLGDSLDVTCEVSGEAGLTRVLSDEDYAVVLCDLSLPDRHGSEIFAELSRSRPGLVSRFVVMTGGAVSEQARDFLDGHEGHVLTKPFTLKDVQAMVDQIVAGSARESA
jgi:CheY-like chemotaxis protein